MHEKYDFSVIRMLRKRHQMTIKQLAAKCGLTYPTVESIEVNKTFPTLKTIDALAGVFGISTSNLLSLCEHVTVLKRPAQFMEAVQGSSLEGVEVCRLASYGSAKVIRVQAPKDHKIHAMEAHDDVYEFCYVLSGQVELWINEKKYLVEENETILFDALLDHSYVQIVAGEYIIVHVPKNTAMLSSVLDSGSSEPGGA